MKYLMSLLILIGMAMPVDAGHYYSKQKVVTRHYSTPVVTTYHVQTVAPVVQAAPVIEAAPVRVAPPVVYTAPPVYSAVPVYSDAPVYVAAPIRSKTKTEHKVRHGRHTSSVKTYQRSG